MIIYKSEKVCITKSASGAITIFAPVNSIRLAITTADRLAVTVECGEKPLTKAQMAAGYRYTGPRGGGHETDRNRPLGRDPSRRRDADRANAGAGRGMAAMRQIEIVLWIATIVLWVFSLAGIAGPAVLVGV